MKINDIFDQQKEFDEFFNPEAADFAEENKKYTAQIRKSLEDDSTPVFLKTSNFEDPYAINWNTHPDKNVDQSAGYRGQQRALTRAGVPHDDNVQKYDPNFINYKLPT